MTLDRRGFLLLTAGLLSSRCSAPSALSLDGGFAGPSHDVGHLLRGGSLPAPARERRVPVVIVGGGIAGLSAGWKLQKSGFTDFEILELEPEAGGNSRYGENAITAYPWGAHYVPLPAKGSVAVRELFEELGVIEGYDPAGKPRYRERYLCFAPQERLFIHGRWQDGLMPRSGARQRDLDQFDRFNDLVLQYRSREAFSIPMEGSGRDPGVLALDRGSIRDFLTEQGFDSLPLHWYVNYACRDDYGCESSDVSAWAGLHYFASRELGENREDTTVLTWPEGNGWIVRQLTQRLNARLRSDCLVYRVHPEKTSVVVDVFHPEEKTATRIIAGDVILCCPSFLALRLMDSLDTAFRAALAEFDYAPWLVANLTLRGFPERRAGVPIAWDNVIYESAALGYVVATHQSLRTHQDRTVFTYYLPLTGRSAREERTRLLETNWETWVEFILSDLSRPHPEIRGLVERIDIFRWGHAMVRPRPGFVWSEARRRVAAGLPNVHFAHSDLSGFSIFEEAQYRGILAAQQVLKKHGVRF